MNRFKISLEFETTHTKEEILAELDNINYGINKNPDKGFNIFDKDSIVQNTRIDTKKETHDYFDYTLHINLK